MTIDVTSFGAARPKRALVVLAGVLLWPAAGAAPGVAAPLAEASVVACGPGLGRSPELTEFVRRMYAAVPAPMVIDADGLNAFARLGCEPRFAAACAVLTPHAGELGRMPGVDAAALKKRPEDLVGELAQRWQVLEADAV